MIVSQINSNGYFVCAIEAERDPLMPGEYLLPAGTIAAAPPILPSGHRARWLEAEWQIEPADPPAEVTPPAPTREQQAARRLAAYRDESDPLFFLAQAGEADAADWSAARAAIRARFPYPASDPEA